MSLSSSRETVTSTVRVTPSRKRRRLPVISFSASLASVLVVFLALPLLGLVVRSTSMRGFGEILGRPLVIEALRLSAFSSAVVVLITLVLGSPLALILARRRFRGIGVLDTVIDLPMVLPPAVAGLALLLTFGRRGMLGGPLSALGVELPFSTAAVVLAELFVAAPFYIRAARAGFMSVPHEIEEAAMMEGANSRQAFLYVTVPLAGPALLGGSVLCWARALGEFGATIMFAGSFQGRTQTMPLAIYSALDSDLDSAIGLSLVLLVASFAILLVFRRWLAAATVGVQ